jgi:hypothetical protein
LLLSSSKFTITNSCLHATPAWDYATIRRAAFRERTSDYDIKDFPRRAARNCQIRIGNARTVRAFSAIAHHCSDFLAR